MTLLGSEGIFNFYSNLFLILIQDGNQFSLGIINTKMQYITVLQPIADKRLKSIEENNLLTYQGLTLLGNMILLLKGESSLDSITWTW